MNSRTGFSFHCNDKFFYPCLFLACLALADGLLLMPEGSPPRAAAAMALLLLPGLAWAEVVLPATGRLTRWCIGAGLGFALAMITGLILRYLPGPIVFWQELVALHVLALAPILILFVAPRSSAGSAGASNVITLSLLAAIVALAVFFCFTDLGYSEFQGDEAEVMAPVAKAMEGYESALFLDRNKGAGEMLLPMLMWGLTGTVDEGIARLPFAVAGVATVLAVYLIGRRLAGEHAGLIAAALLALNGFLVAFARIVQYQTLVMWLGALALLCAWEWRAGLQSRWAALAGIFLASGLWAHFDMLVIVPVLGYVALTAILNSRPTGAVWRITPFIRSLSVAVSLLFVIGGLFFVPYLLNAQSGRTIAYLGRRIGTGMLKNGLDNFVSSNIFYTSFYYLLFTGSLLLGFLAWAIHRIRVIRRLPGSGYWVPALAIVAPVALMVWPQVLRTPGLDLAAIPFAAILLGAFLSPALVAHQRDVVAWLAVSFMGYVFFIERPVTHIYVIALPWVILAGLAAAKLLDLAAIATRRRQVLLAACAGLLVALFGGYLYIAYVRHDTEFWEDWPRSRAALYWAPPPYDELPRTAVFGMVHQSGWKGIGALYDSGRLAGDFDTNEKPEMAVWYTRNAVRPTREEIKACGEPEYYFIADDLVEGQDLWAVSPEILRAGYADIGRIDLPNGKGITIYQARPTTRDLGRLNIADLSPAFDATAVPSAFIPALKPSQPADVNLHGAVRLIGYDLDLRRATPGGRIAVTLYWKALVDIPVDLHVFVHLESANGAPPGVWGQSNGTPACGLSPTHGWKAGDVIADRRALAIKPDTPPGDYAILTGMYLPENGARLDVRDAGGNPIGNATRLTTLSIRQLGE
jgi:4-amino-4-deoxy-L-arabinose transferase-like glycosyltransferase